ncbi:uncharacterized protein LOC120256705 [Dioscorea cayenensis subsp. rotundata]|uniref:Uncharacterized protein LOC120256705 n=1 Tax=Dioscorea cayennensis subsp. rotundata TaxID=55577 RepID=A0AB40AZA1_DIOCR|nr:uncharacterized protein LOC120256705 [Dioscorea cayenensis subsp. rotundata]
MVVHRGNPFRMDISKPDNEMINGGKHGLISSMEENSEDTTPFSYGFGENRLVNDENFMKDDQKESKCSVLADEFDTEWNPFLVDMLNLDNETATTEGNIENGHHMVDGLEAICSIPASENVCCIAYQNNPFLMDILKLDNENVIEGEHTLPLPTEKKIFDGEEPCKDFEPAQSSLGHAKDDGFAKAPYSGVHHGNPFLDDVPELDDENVTGGHNGFALPMANDIFEEEMQLPAQCICDLGEESFKSNEINLKNNQTEDVHIEVPCSIASPEFDTDFDLDKLVSESEMDVCKTGSFSDEKVNSPEKIETEINGRTRSISSELNHSQEDNDNIVMEGVATGGIPSSPDIRESPVNGNSISVFDKDAEEKLCSGRSEAKEILDSTHQDKQGSSISILVFDVTESKPNHGLGGTTADNSVKSEATTFNFDSAGTNSSNTEENKEDKAHQSCKSDVLNRGIEDTATDGATASNQNSVLHPSRGESSFSGLSSLPGPIIASGRIPFSGSISYRSDSSTTSARSFAFPILPTEWNSSPVKMAKADQRQLRKQRFWRILFFCCRF